MANQTFLEDGDIIYALSDGDQDAAVVQKYVDDVTTLMHGLIDQKKPVLILSNVSTVGHVDLEARKLANKAMTEWPFQKLAIFGANVFLRNLIRFVITASGRSSQIHVFNNEDEAKKWLRQQ